MAAFFISFFTPFMINAAAPVEDAKMPSKSSAKTNIHSAKATKATKATKASKASKASSPSNKLRPDVRLDRLERTSEARTKILIGLQRDFNDIAAEVATLSGKIEEHNYQLEKILQRQRDLYQELERRLSAQPVAGTPAEPETPVAAVSAAATAVTVENASSAAVVMQSDDKGADAAYDAAVALVIKDKRYTDAVPAFQSFIANYPNSPYKPNAHYWLGQLLYSQNDKPGALVQFKVLITDFENSNKRGDALFKSGIISLSMQETESAIAYFEQVILEYPGSASAKLARDELNKIRS